MEILFILIFTLLLVWLLVPLGGYRTYHSYRPRTPAEVEEERAAGGVGVGLTMLFFFFLLFPLILAGSFWVEPYGPAFMGISWAPILIIGFLLALLIAALSPREPRPVVREEDNPDEPVATGIAAVFGIVFFILLIAALALVVAAMV